MAIVIKETTTRAKLDTLLKKINVKKGIDAKKYCGVIKLKEDSLDIQKKLRDEWE